MSEARLRSENARESTPGSGTGYSEARLRSAQATTLGGVGVSEARLRSAQTSHLTSSYQSQSDARLRMTGICFFKMFYIVTFFKQSLIVLIIFIIL